MDLVAFLTSHVSRFIVEPGGGNRVDSGVERWGGTAVTGSAEIVHARLSGQVISIRGPMESMTASTTGDPVAVEVQRRVMTGQAGVVLKPRLLRDRP